PINWKRPKRETPNRAVRSLLMVALRIPPGPARVYSALFSAHGARVCDFGGLLTLRPRLHSESPPPATTAGRCRGLKRCFRARKKWQRLPWWLSIRCRCARPKVLLVADDLCHRQKLMVLQRRRPRPRRFWILAYRGSAAGEPLSSS